MVFVYFYLLWLEFCDLFLNYNKNPNNVKDKTTSSFKFKWSVCWDNQAYSLLGGMHLVVSKSTLLTY